MQQHQHQLSAEGHQHPFSELRREGPQSGITHNARPAPVTAAIATVWEEVRARQRVMACAIESSRDAPAGCWSWNSDGDDDEPVLPPTNSPPNQRTPIGLRKSPSLNRKSPGSRGGSQRHRGDPPATRILDFLFLGSVHDARNVEFLRRNHITTIINVSQEEYYSPDPERVVVRWFHAEDSSSFDIQKYFAQTEHMLSTARKFYFQERDPSQRKRVLVHCQRGISRSATIVMAHLIKSNGWSVAEALHWVSSLRDVVEPNLGFMEALREYQEGIPDTERKDRRWGTGLLIRNMLSEEVVAESSSVRAPHTPLERDARTSADGTEYPLLTLETVKKFFEESIGMVVKVQIQVKIKEVPLGIAPGDDDEEEDPTQETAQSDSGGLLSSEGRSETTEAFQHGSSSNESDANARGSFAGGDNSSKAALEAVATAASRRELRRSDSKRSLVVKSAQILVEFACHENVLVACRTKKQHPERFFPISDTPSKLLFQSAAKARRSSQV